MRPQRSCQLPSKQCISSWPRVAKVCVSVSLFGVGRGSTPASDRWVVKTIYEIAF